MAGVNELVAALGNENITVRTQAVHHLVQRIGPQSAVAVRPAVESGSGMQRAHGLWVLARLGELTSADIRRLAADPDRLVRVQLTQALAGLDWDLLGIDLRQLLFGLLQDSDPFVRRAAADVLGQHPARENIEPLLALWQSAPADDTHLVHMTRISLRDTLASLGDLQGVTQDFSMRTEAYRRIAEIVLGVNQPSAGPFLLEYLKSPAVDAGRGPDFVQHAAAHLPAEKLPELYAYAVTLRSGQNSDQQVAILRALYRALQVRALPLPTEIRQWAIELANNLLAAAPDGTARTGIELTRDLRLTETAPALEKLCAGGAPAARLRQPALEVLAVIDGPRAVPLLGKFVEDGTEPVAARQKGADLLGSVNSAESRTELLRLLRTVPDQVALAIARGLATGVDGGQALLALVAEGKASARLLQDVIVTERLKGTKLPDLEARLSKLLQDLPSEDERFRQLLTARQAGYGKATPSPVKGAEVYEKICANCHRVGGKGGKVGPELDGIGVRGLDRLLEDILLPSRNVDQAFRSTAIELKDGKSVTGLKLREEGEVLVIANETGKEVRVVKADIDEQRVMRISPMPANIAEQLSDADFYHLVNYLLTLKNTAAAPKP
ncbi:MAG TPA: HEAT repeat domain-containing protein [Planctomycetaceae bacterium]|nr:HEAT repeat domain-containing protein [Planctomycetaceae bacterium]